MPLPAGVADAAATAVSVSIAEAPGVVEVVLDEVALVEVVGLSPAALSVAGVVLVDDEVIVAPDVVAPDAVVIWGRLKFSAVIGSTRTGVSGTRPIKVLSVAFDCPSVALAAVRRCCESAKVASA